MPTFTVKEIQGERGYSVNMQNETTYNKAWHVVCDDPNVVEHAPATAFAEQTGISIGTPYGLNSFCTNVSVRAHPTEPTQWVVTATFGSNQGEPNISPLAKAAKIDISFSQFDKPIQRDLNGVPILNSAGLPPSDPIIVDDSRPLISITRNLEDFPFVLAYTYKDATNAGAFMQCPPGTCKVQSISSRREFDQIYGWYWPTSVTIAVDLNGWDKRILDDGYQELVPDGEGWRLEQIWIDGELASSPQLLDGQGRRLPPVQTGAQPVFRGPYRVYPRLPYTVFMGV